ncbi:Filamin-A [Gryllus bimaculatus]|nr:Filamin-A [Gryllus bimaculatus]
MSDGVEDEVEHPVCRTLFRQSSLEMRVEAEEPPDSSDSEEVEYAQVCKPRVVDAVLKASHPAVSITPPSPQEDQPPKQWVRSPAPPEKEKQEGKEEEKDEGGGGDKVKHSDKNKDEDTQDKNEEDHQMDKNKDEGTQKDMKKKDQDQDQDQDKEDGHKVQVRFKDPPEHNERHSYVGTLRGLATKSSKNSSASASSHATARPTSTAATGAAMASPRPKSPRPPVTRKDEKEESFWEKIGTLGRKKRIKEVQEVQEEGKHAIDSPGSPTAPDLPPEDYTLEENEERSMIEPRSFDDPKLRELIAVLIEWINDELADQRIIVKDIEEDLYDGQVLQKLLEKLSSQKLDVPEVTQSEEGQKQKLGIVLAAANKVLGHPRWSQQKWSVESIHSKNLVAILHLLVALARHFRAPVRLPENVAVEVVVVQKREGSLSHRTVLEEITSHYDELGMRCERDAFDTLFDHAPDKLQVVKKSLVTFVNKHLNKVNLEVTDLDTQFHDGVYLTILMGLLEGFFVPLYSFHLTPQDFDQKVHNVSFAFELMQDVGIAKPKARPEDIVNLDLKSTLRVLYNLFTKYKNMS